MKYNFIILLTFASWQYISSNVITIRGVSNLCYNPHGRLGRCLTVAKCLRVKGDVKDILNWPCYNGRGLPPYVCCTFGNSIVFPDDDDDGEGDANDFGNSGIMPFGSSKFFRDLGQRNGDKIKQISSGSVSIASEDGNTENRKNETALLINEITSDVFPQPGVCGPLMVDDKIHGGWEAQLGEFPWLVNLEYRTAFNYLAIACAGSILNQRYVVTAGHCISGGIQETVGILESLRAGDHNVQTFKDCDKDGYCIDPYQRLFIEQTWVHEDFYVTKKRKIFNDIALVKTTKDIVYSNSVAPICLPLVMPGLEPPKNGSRLTVAGWGSSRTANYTDEKRIVDLICLDDEKCRIRDELSRLCVGGETGKDSCDGDSGGSLARRTKDGWVLEGIVSYGVGCGDGKPAVYTRVRTFINWIRDHLLEV
ncbi:serine protease 7-like [Musca domestica]|uniref:Serine protease 7-like n=1 Tax=Musca domestica TaxID=7370 RepID=A0ABM3VF09_MUSDO|nr:serine protease 7-like [Musca domestica]